MTCFGSQQRSNCTVLNKFISLVGILSQNQWVYTQFTQAFCYLEFTVSKLASRYHWWINLLHQQVWPQFNIFLNLQQLLFQFFIKEVIPTTFFLWLKHEPRRVFQSFFYLHISLCTFAIIFKWPYTLEKMFYWLGGFLALSHLLQQKFVW
jgi:hypothetical protein